MTRESKDAVALVITLDCEYVNHDSIIILLQINKIKSKFCNIVLRSSIFD